MRPMGRRHSRPRLPEESRAYGNGPAVMRRRIIASLLCCLVLAPGVRAQDEAPSRGILNNEALRAALSVIRGIASQVAFHWGSTQDTRYGLFLDDDWQQRANGRPLVVIVHGYGSSAAEFDALRGRLREAGFGCAVFSYPNDAAVALSARQFAAALTEFERRYPDRVGQTYRLMHNPRHRWVYFPRMRRDEALVFKVYDSAKDGRARFTPHTSFDDPTTPAGAAPRQSIEARALAFFEN